MKRFYCSLWNGAMADYNTVFVEVPLETFAPAKTVLDLLKPQHQWKSIFDSIFQLKKEIKRNQQFYFDSFRLHEFCPIFDSIFQLKKEIKRNQQFYFDSFRLHEFCQRPNCKCGTTKSVGVELEKVEQLDSIENKGKRQSSTKLPFSKELQTNLFFLKKIRSIRNDNDNDK